MFDAREYTQAFEAPVYIDTHGTEHRGRILSAFEMDEITKVLADESGDPRERWRTALHIMFPSANGAVEEMLGLPAAAWGILTADFFARQRLPETLRPASPSASESSPPR